MLFLEISSSTALTPLVVGQHPHIGVWTAHYRVEYNIAKDKRVRTEFDLSEVNL